MILSTTFDVHGRAVAQLAGAFEVRPIASTGGRFGGFDRGRPQLLGNRARGARDAAQF